MPDIEALRDSALWQFLQLHSTWIAPSIALLSFIESLAVAGILVPGVVLLAAAALMAGGAEVSLWWVLGCAFAGAVTGDITSFFIGRRLGPRLDQLWLLDRHPEWIVAGRQFFYRHGAMSVVLGRFVGPLRPFMPLLAGSLGFPAWRFVFINLASAVGWAPVYILPGYLLGASVAHRLQQPDGLIIGLIVLGGWLWACGQVVASAWRLGTPSESKASCR